MGMQTVALHILHHEVNILIRVDGFIELDNSVVIKSAKDPNLANRLLFPLNVHQFRSVILFDCNFFPAWLMNTFFHNCIRTMANSLAKMVIV